MKDPTKMTVELLCERPLETRFGRWTEWLFRAGGSDVVVLGLGDWRGAESALIRVHSTCFAAHYLQSTECDCREQLDLALQRIADEGAGLLIFLEQEGRGNGHAARMRATIHAEQTGCTQAEAYRALGYPAEARSFAGAAAVLMHLGVRSVRLLTNNPAKVGALVEAGLAAVPTPLAVPAAERPDLARFYRNKAREGHLLSDE